MMPMSGPMPLVVCCSRHHDCVQRLDLVLGPHDQLATEHVRYHQRPSFVGAAAAGSVHRSVVELAVHVFLCYFVLFFFFFNDTATTEIYTLSLHDALPI